MFKKIFISLVIFLSLAFSVNAYDYSNVKINSMDAEVLYKFSDGSGTIVKDSSGNEHDMIIKSGVWSTDTPNANYPYSIQNLRGVIGSKSPQFTNANGVTMSIWWKPTSLSGTQDIWANYGVTDEKFSVLRLYTDGNFYAYFYDDLNNVQYNTQTPVSTIININQWNLITQKIDLINKELKLFVNGVLVQTVVLNANVMTNLDLANIGSIGSYNTGVYQASGFITGVEVINKALLDQDIINKYTSNLPAVRPQNSIFLKDFDGVFFKTGGTATFNADLGSLSTVKYNLNGGTQTLVNTNAVNNFNLQIPNLVDGVYNISFEINDGTTIKTFTTQFEMKSDYTILNINSCPQTIIQDFTEYSLNQNFVWTVTDCFILPNHATYVKINANNHPTFSQTFGGANAHGYLTKWGQHLNGLEITGFNLKDIGDFSKNDWWFSLAYDNINKGYASINNVNIHDNYLNAVNLVFGNVKINVMDSLARINYLTLKNNVFKNIQYFIYDVYGKSIYKNVLIENNDVNIANNNANLNYMVSSPIFSTPKYFFKSTFQNNNFFSAWATKSADDFFEVAQTYFPTCSDIIWTNQNIMSSPNNRGLDNGNTGLTSTPIVRQSADNCLYSNTKEKTVSQPMSTLFPNKDNTYFLNTNGYSNFVKGGIYYPTSNIINYLGANSLDSFQPDITFDFSFQRSQYLRTYSSNHDIDFSAPNKIHFSDNTFFGNIKYKSQDFETFNTPSTQWASSTGNDGSFANKITDSIADLITPEYINGFFNPQGLIGFDDNSQLSGIKYEHYGNGNHWLIDAKSSTNADNSKMDNNKFKSNLVYLRSGNAFISNGVRFTGDNPKIEQNYFYADGGNTVNFLELNGWNFDGQGNYKGQGGLIANNYFYNRNPANTGTVRILKGNANGVSLVNNYIDDGYTSKVWVFDPNNPDKTGVNLNGNYDLIYNGFVYTFNVGNYYTDGSNSILCTDFNSNGFCDTVLSVPVISHDGKFDLCALSAYPYDFIAHIGDTPNSNADCGLLSKRPVVNSAISILSPVSNQNYVIDQTTPSIQTAYTVTGGEGVVSCSILYDGQAIDTKVITDGLQNDFSLSPTVTGYHDYQVKCIDDTNLYTSSNVINFHSSVTSYVDPNANTDTTAGCTDIFALNYDANATSNDGSCVYSNGGGNQTIINGCTDNTATNYDPNATNDDGSCVYSNGGGNDNLGSGDIPYESIQIIDPNDTRTTADNSVGFFADLSNGLTSIGIVLAMFFFVLLLVGGIINLIN